MGRNFKHLKMLWLTAYVGRGVFISLWLTKFSSYFWYIYFYNIKTIHYFQTSSVYIFMILTQFRQMERKSTTQENNNQNKHLVQTYQNGQYVYSSLTLLLLLIDDVYISSDTVSSKFIPTQFYLKMMFILARATWLQIYTYPVS